GSDRKLSLTVTPPNVPDPNNPPAHEWKDFKTAVDTFVTQMQAYAALVAPKAVKDFAQAVVDLVKPFARDRVANWPGQVSNQIAQPKTLETPWVLGFPAENFAPIRIDTPNGWGWPTDPPEQATNAAARVNVAKLFDDAIAAAAGARVNRLKALKVMML